MSEAESIALARQKYQDLQALKSQPTFYDYEKRFVAIFGNTDQGKQWIDEQWERLLKSDLPAVLPSIEALQIDAQLRGSIKKYLSKNAFRMDYQNYQKGASNTAYPIKPL